VNKDILKLYITIIIIWVYLPGYAQQSSIVINEIYFDVNPTIGLPEVEYVELFNNSTEVVNLNGWSFKDTGSPKIFSEDFLFEPQTYLLLTGSENVEELSNYGSVINIGFFRGLSNDGDDLTLCSTDGKVVHNVNYKKKWLNDSTKEEGGWALELIDPDNYCGLGLAENWAASIDPKGGTPGALNSVDGSTVDEVAPAIKTITVLNNNTIQVQFTEAVELPGITDVDNYSLSGDSGNLTITNLFVCSEENTCIEIEINENLTPNVLFNLSVSKLFDCAGNEINGIPENFVLPGSIEPFSIVINEILYDPIAGVAEYIELYNQTDKLFDLNNLNIQDLTNTDNIITSQNLLQPKSYALLTEDTLSIINTYQPPVDANLVQVESIPTLNDSGDVIRLTNENFSIIDSVQYNPDWHFRLLRETNGVALERISFDAPSQDAGNWHSASKSVNYGTPGYKNSQTMQMSNQTINKIINITNKTLSPDGDGFEDFLTINYKTKKSGETANVYIYNEIGQLIAHPVKNELLGETGTFKWDGLDETGARIPIGIYIVYAEFFDLNGNVNKQKIPVVVAGRL